ncbi:MAG: 2-hydroxyacid dehydrogenase [Aminivibrio sp.]|jgi:phosphoglycerate dehydrogenase-like enzyme|nr:glyoxylate reductase [Synergistaceae bacterium]
MKVVFWGKEFSRLKETLERNLEGREVVIADVGDDSALAEAGMLVVRPVTVDDRLLSKAPRLKLVQQWGAGAEGIDVEACRRRGIYACNVPSIGMGNAEGVAEVALLHMLILAKRLFRSREKLMEGKVYTPPGITLWGKTACVIGLGNVGRTIASRLKAFGMTVRGVNRTPPGDGEAWGVDEYFPLSGLKDAVKGARFAVAALALAPETEGLLDGDFFSAMDGDAFFINVARGGIVSRDALLEALDGGKIAGAGLDVLWEEPHRTDDPFLTHPKVSVTPHIGGVNDAAMEGTLRFIAQNAALVAEGREPMGRLDKKDRGRRRDP